MGLNQRRGLWTRSQTGNYAVQIHTVVIRIMTVFVDTTFFLILDRPEPPSMDIVVVVFKFLKRKKEYSDFLLRVVPNQDFLFLHFLTSFPSIVSLYFIVT